DAGHRRLTDAHVAPEFTDGLRPAVHGDQDPAGAEVHAELARDRLVAIRDERGDADERRARGQGFHARSLGGRARRSRAGIAAFRPSECRTDVSGRPYPENMARHAETTTSSGMTSVSFPLYSGAPQPIGGETSRPPREDRMDNEETVGGYAV